MYETTIHLHRDNELSPIRDVLHFQWCERLRIAFARRESHGRCPRGCHCCSFCMCRARIAPGRIRLTLCSCNTIVSVWSRKCLWRQRRKLPPTQALHRTEKRALTSCCPRQQLWCAACWLPIWLGLPSPVAQSFLQFVMLLHLSWHSSLGSLPYLRANTLSCSSCAPSCRS